VTVITVKGLMDLDEYTDMLAWHSVHMSSPGLPDFDQFFIECAIKGFREVTRDE